MIDIKSWIKIFVEKAEKTFGDRIWFVGLQGSYGRGEATETSDIDVVVVLDEMKIGDLKTYRGMLDKLPNRELICGFVSGKAELLKWEPSDLFQFYYDTTPIKGSLDGLLEKIDKPAVRRAIHIGACNIYHACVHNFVHEKSEDVLRSQYKSAVFLLQAVCFYRSGKYYKSKSELSSAVGEKEKAIIETERDLKNGGKVELENMTEALLGLTKNILGEIHG